MNDYRRLPSTMELKSAGWRQENVKDCDNRKKKNILKCHGLRINYTKMKKERPMKTVTVDEIQKNFSHILKEMNAGEEIAVTRRGQPVAKITALGPKKDIDWPDFYNEARKLKGKPACEIVIEGREDRF